MEIETVLCGPPGLRPGVHCVEAFPAREHAYDTRARLHHCERGRGTLDEAPAATAAATATLTTAATATGAGHMSASAALAGVCAGARAA